MLCFLLFFFGRVDAQVTKNEILWDNYGVPHIYGKTTAAMYYAFGWAQMHNHANLVLQLYGVARGKAAEYWGKNYVRNDEVIQKFDLAGISQKVYEQQHPEYKSYLDAFVKGMNDYATAHPEAIDKVHKQILPVISTDVIAHTINVLCLGFIASNDIYSSVKETLPGSNALAIAPSRSASKHTMLMANPHLPWQGYFTFFEAHLNAPGFNAYGATLIGMPVLAIAFNNNLGWTHTVNPINASTRYELTLKDNGYLLDGKVLPFETRNVTLKIKQSDGTLKEEQLVCKYTKQGPVIAEKGNKAFAVRIAGLHNVYFNEQYHKMAKASNFAEFQSAVKMLQMPMFNVIYADKGGNIMYLFGGDVPVRTEGDFWFWHNKVDGTLSKYIATKNLTYSELPKVIDPASGFVQNANDAPWLCTYPMVLDRNKFPSYIAPDLWYAQDYREQRIINLIKDKHSITFDELVGYKLNTGLETADRSVDELVKDANEYPDSLTHKAAAVLKAWDRHTDTASRGAVLYIQWCFDLNPDSIFRNKWSFSDPLNTPNGLKYPEYAARKSKQAANEVIKHYGALDVPWGSVYRFKSGNVDLPANGTFSTFGSYRAINYRPDRDHKFTAAGGDSYVAVTEFGKQVKAMVSLSYGNASQPGSKHITDQLKLMSDKKLRPALLSRTDIIKNLEEKEELSFK
ncbi:MAG: Cephalosporin acylase [Mucilaginibacter sp.]|nr:Cephalosporin acylase [Mucilaginibacter sp.]